MVANHDAIDIPPRDGVVPNARMVSGCHVAQHHCSLRDVHSLAKNRAFPQK
jgi:hypothetical protein